MSFVEMGSELKVKLPYCKVKEGKKRALFFPDFSVLKNEDYALLGKVYLAVGTLFMVTIVSIVLSVAFYEIIKANIVSAMISSIVLAVVSYVLAKVFSKNSVSFLFAIIMSISIGVALSPMFIYFPKFFNNFYSILLVSAVEVVALCILLSLYALFAKSDFSYLIYFVFGLLLTILIGFVLYAHYDLPEFVVFVSVCCSLIFSSLIVLNTNSLLNNEFAGWAVASSVFYINLMNLFSSLLTMNIRFGATVNSDNVKEIFLEPRGLTTMPGTESGSDV